MTEKKITPNQILLGDCHDVLKTIPDACVDSIVCDPPYGLGTKEPTGADIVAYLSGSELDHGGDFMGANWSIPSVAIWKECYRVLKPGGHLLSFGGTRTLDLISVGIRAAGFENRDTIATQFGVTTLQYIQGSGFPKSLNISKAIDKLLGKEREVIGKVAGMGKQNPEWNGTAKGRKENSFKPEYDATAPATDEAQKWEGWGTSLKPSWEPILVFRKPLEEKTVAAQVLATGTGGLNIDACRVSSGPSEGGTISGSSALGQNSGWNSHNNITTKIDRAMPSGRWPANVLLVHSDACKIVGYKKVPAPVINRFTDGMKPFGDGAGHSFVSEKTGDANGLEEIPIYECVEGCPVKVLDEQSGDRPSTGNHPSNAKAKSKYRPDQGAYQQQGPLYSDSGGASRFFGQIQPDAPFLYTSKASKSERNKGLVVKGFDASNLVVLKENLSDEDQEKLMSEWPSELPEPDMPIEKDRVPENLAAFFEPLKVGNWHPCLHPETLVFTQSGYKPINAITIGEKVYTADGSFHPVTDISIHPYKSSNLYEIYVQGAFEATLASDNHPFLIWRPERKKKKIIGGEVLWLRADQIKKGDYTLTPILRQGDGNNELPKDIDFWFLFGLYLAEGIVQKAGHGLHVYPSFSLHEKEVHLIKRIRDYFNSVGIYPCRGTQGVQVVAFDHQVGALFSSFGGRGCSTKQLSPIIWTLEQKYLRAILAGWLAGDGGIVRREYQGKTTSLALASQLQLIGEMCADYRVRINRSIAPKNAGIGNRKFKSTRPHYQINFNPLTYIPRSGVRFKTPNKKTINYNGCVYTLRYVKKVLCVPYKGDVVNLSVEGNPTFQTVVGISHNTLKPMALMTWLVKLVTPKGGTTLDPFCGSGTTCIAALDCDCNYIGIEKDPVYHDLAIRRIKGLATELEEKAAQRRQEEAFDLIQNLPQEGE